MLKKDYLLAGVPGVITGIFLIPILAGAGIRLPFSYAYLIIIIPILEMSGYVIASLSFRHIEVMRQIGRYSIIGFTNFCIDAGLLLVLSNFTGIGEGVNIIPLNIISGSIAIVHSFFWNHFWTFRSRVSPNISRFTKFVVVTLGGVAINTTIVYVLTTYVSMGSFNNSQQVLAAKITAALVGLAWNFMGYKFIVFKHHAPRPIDIEQAF